MKITLLLLLLSTSLNSWSSFKITTFNIRNFDHDQRSNVRTNKEELAGLLKQADSDLIGVQEIVKDRLLESFIQQIMPTHLVKVSECGGAHDQKLGFVYRADRLKLLSFTEDLRLSIGRTGEEPSCSGSSRPAAIGIFQDLQTQQKMIAISVHLKSGGNDSDLNKRKFQLETLKTILNELMAEHAVKNFVIMGDFNTTQYTFRKEEYKRFVDYVRDLSAHDMSAKVECSAYWWGGIRDNIEYPSLLDHIIVSKTLIEGEYTVEAGAHCQRNSCEATHESDVGITYDEVSDHCPITATLK
jgi:endonuclease/exonuclease/phosphatase family metal-dependent hydrolase